MTERRVDDALEISPKKYRYFDHDSLTCPEMSDNKQTKRPLSHRWVFSIFAIITVGVAVTAIDFANRRSGANLGPYLKDGFAFLLVGPVGLAGLVFGGRRKWGYYLTAGSLAVYISRAAYTTALSLHGLTNGQTVSKPYFHLAERNQPFVVEQRISGTKEFLTVAFLGLLIWLFVRFAFGRPSRDYYGFRTTEKNAPDAQLT